jgi:fructokinase
MSFKVLGVGEVLWDLLPAGAQMGGAPANFAYHANALGARAGVVTRVGLDPLGQDIRRQLAALGLPLELVQVDETAPTGTVSVELVGDGIPRFTIREQVAWDHLHPTEAALQAASEADAICFGSLAQRAETSRSTIHRVLAQAPATALRVCDINLRQNFYSREVIQKSLCLANVLKLNDTELPIVATMLGLTGDLEAQVATLAREYDLRVVALTCGPQGSLLYQAGRWSECVTRPVRVKDTVGAGDAFTAALVLGLLRKMDLDEVNRFANEVARHVCSCAGATPPLPDELRSRLATPVNATEVGKLTGPPTPIPTLQ